MVLSHTIGHNIFNSGIDGFSFSVDHETVKVLPNVFITTDSGDGIQSDYPNSVLINSGSIIAGLEVGGSFGVFFTNTSNDSKIRNSIGASIIGRDGVDMYGSGSQIFHNFGSIVATVTYGLYFGTQSQSVVLNNHGTILSASHGVSVSSDHSGGKINNYNLIKADAVGIEINTVSNLTTTILNAVGGIIKGTMDAIFADNGMFALTNFGKIIGNITDDNDVRDVVANHGIIQGLVKLAGGNDVFDGNGGSSGQVFGGNGKDHLSGGTHADRLHGEDGNDVVTGRLGADRFCFDTALNATANVDQITDFTPAQGDKIVLELSQFAGLGLPTLER